MFLKLTELLGHVGDIARHILDLADQGMAINQHVLDKAKAIEGTLKPFIDLMGKSPVTVSVPIPPEHAPALKAGK